MSKKNTPNPIDRVIAELSHERTMLDLHGLNPDYAEELLHDAVSYLRECRDMKDVSEVANMDVAEIGAIIRRQRERIAFLESERNTWKRDYISACHEAEGYARTLRQMGAL